MTLTAASQGYTCSARRATPAVRQGLAAQQVLAWLAAGVAKDHKQGAVTHARPRPEAGEKCAEAGMANGPPSWRSGLTARPD
eukprot:13078738-Alexandrium_andersonii.AAC.1